MLCHKYRGQHFFVYPDMDDILEVEISDILSEAEVISKGRKIFALSNVPDNLPLIIVKF